MIYVQTALSWDGRLTADETRDALEVTETHFKEATRLVGGFAAGAPRDAKGLKTLKPAQIDDLWDGWTAGEGDEDGQVPRHYIFDLHVRAQDTIEAQDWSALGALWSDVLTEIGLVFEPSSQLNPLSAFTRYTLRGFHYLRESLKTAWWDIDSTATAPRNHEVATRIVRMTANQKPAPAKRTRKPANGDKEAEADAGVEKDAA